MPPETKSIEQLKKKVEELEREVEKWQEAAGNAYKFCANAANALKARDAKDRWDKISADFATASADKAPAMLRETVTLCKFALHAEYDSEMAQQQYEMLKLDMENDLSAEELKKLERIGVLYEDSINDMLVQEMDERAFSNSLEKTQREMKTFMERVSLCLDGKNLEEANKRKRVEENGEEDENPSTKKTKTASD